MVSKPRKPENRTARKRRHSRRLRVVALASGSGPGGTTSRHLVGLERTNSPVLSLRTRLCQPAGLPA